MVDRQLNTEVNYSRVHVDWNVDQWRIHTSAIEQDSIETWENLSNF